MTDEEILKTVEKLLMNISLSDMLAELLETSPFIKLEWNEKET
jgi:hypothetical protein